MKRVKIPEDVFKIWEKYHLKEKERPELKWLVKKSKERAKKLSDELTSNKIITKN